MTIKACVFDAYGTLFDVSAAAREAAAEPRRETFAKKWPAIADIWRKKQLEYTWLRAVAGAHTDFWRVTGDGLDYALEAEGLDGDAELRERLLALYHQLSAYEEVPEMLATLKAAGYQTAILSNGSPDMLSGAVGSAGVTAVIDHILSVESVGVFKPHHSVYDLVGTCFDVKPEEVLFVSSNGWDVACAAGYGFRTVWVNRAGAPLERLPWTPERQLPDLRDIPAIAKEWS